MISKVLACFVVVVVAVAGFASTTTAAVGIYKISSNCLLRICSPMFDQCSSSSSKVGSPLTVRYDEVRAINDLHVLKPVITDSPFYCSCSDVYQYRRLIGCNCNLNFPDNGTCRVTSIDFSNMALRGTLNERIGNLSFLTYLDLRGNKLYGLVPTSLVNLIKISFLNLCDNFLEGPLPAFNRNNTELRGLYLCKNQLNGSIPKELGDLPNLISLYLFQNRLTGPIPAEIWNITTLKQLKLQDNQINGQVLEQLGNLENLEQLLLMNNNFSGGLPKSIGNLTSLQNLKIQGSNFNGTIPDAISQLPNLQMLWLIGNNLTGPLPKTFSSNYLSDLAISDVSGDGNGNQFPDVGKMTNLSRMTLKNCSLTGKIPDEIWQLPNLTYLDLSFNKLVGQIPPTLGRNNFRTIYLRRNNLSGSLPRWVDETQIYADLSDNLFTGDATVNGAMSNHTNLFSSCSSTTSTALKWLDSNYRCANDKPTYDHLYINCGGNAETVNGSNYETDLDRDGRSSFFLSDNSAWGYSSMGESLYSPKYNKYLLNETCNISMVDAPLYTGARTAPMSLKYYGFCLKNDNYTVRLHFAEIGWGTTTKSISGRRVFNVEIQGKTELQDFNIEEEAGGMYRSITREFNTTVNDSRLEIHLYWSGKGSMFVPQQYGPLISAISVSPVPKKHHKLSAAIIGAIVGSSLVFVVLIIALFWKLGWLGGKNPNKDGVELYPGGIYKFQEIKDATNNFDPGNKLGEGGSVYKGKLKDEVEIAVKVLSAKSKRGALQILQEIGLVYALEHPNIAKPMGCCTKDREVLLVYKYMENISLQYALFGPDDIKSTLNWQMRLKICLGIAKGLAFLHEESKLDIIHSNIKPTNILLDKDFSVKISDFGYSELHDDGQVNEQDAPNTPRAKDTGHMAPEYMLGRPLTPKSDVYSFGLVTLEIISGQPHIIVKAKQDIYLINTAYKCYAEDRLEALIDESLKDYKFNEVVSVLHLAMQCVSPSFDLRPTMSEVVQILEGKKKLKRKHIYALPVVEPRVAPSTSSTGSGMSSEEGSSRRNISDSQSGEMEDSL